MGASHFGLENTGAIGTLTNHAGATIQGNNTGICQNGAIATLTNNGIITATADGIFNDYAGLITQVTNTSTISGSNGGLYNYHQVDTITNSGIIQGTAGAGIHNDSSGGFSPAYIAVLANSGTISSSNNYGIQNSGNLDTISTIGNFSSGVISGLNLTMRGVELVPAAGLRLASAGGAHFAESATGIASAFAVRGKTAQYNSVQPYVMLNAGKSFVTQSGITVRPDVSIGYEYEAGTHGVSTMLMAADGTRFQTPHNNLDPGEVLFSAGISAGRNNWSLFIGYTARVSGNWNTQTAEAGFRSVF